MNSLKNKIISSNNASKKRKNASKDKDGANPPRKSYPKPSVIQHIKSSSELPIAALRAQLVESVRQFPTTIIVGETGSGKSTQLVQYLADEFHGKNQDGCIVCTQPRRVAAVTIAQRVAAERGCAIGEEVGYSIRFEDRTTHKTKIKFVTGTVKSSFRQTLCDLFLRNVTSLMECRIIYPHDISELYFPTIMRFTEFYYRYQNIFDGDFIVKMVYC